MEILVITGVSGAGKSLVAKTLEDLGYFCVDNMPPSLIPKFVEIASQSGSRMDLIAFVVDVRGGEFLSGLFPGLDSIKKIGLNYEILFLEASDEVLVKRFKESRRSHPLAQEGRPLPGIKKERALLEEIRKKADHIIDTSNLTPSQLKEEIRNIFVKGIQFKGMVINVMSFGFKYGMPIECDLVFDVRFIPNPYYIEAMRKKTGKDASVRDYVLKSEETKVFLEKLYDMLDFLIPNYIKEGKSQLVIGIGCTGGRHRSVAIADVLYESLSKNQYTVTIEHRDIYRDGRSVG